MSLYDDRNKDFISDSNLDRIDFAFRLKITRPRTPFKLAALWADNQFKLHLIDKYGGNFLRLQRLITVSFSLKSYLENCVIYVSSVNHEVYNESF